MKFMVETIKIYTTMTQEILYTGVSETFSE